MKYTRTEKLDIGRRIYNGEITKYEASEEYEISMDSARDYMRLYRDANGLPPKSRSNPFSNSGRTTRVAESRDLNELESMTKEELIQEIINARIREARLKKGYEVKGDGTVILYDKKNIK